MFVGQATQLTGSTVLVGYAVEDMEILLLDDDGAPIEDGGIGEIAIKSRYLAVGDLLVPAEAHTPGFSARPGWQ